MKKGAALAARNHKRRKNAGKVEGDFAGSGVPKAF